MSPRPEAPRPLPTPQAEDKPVKADVLEHYAVSLWDISKCNTH